MLLDLCEGALITAACAPPVETPADNYHAERKGMFAGSKGRRSIHSGRRRV